MTSHPAYAQGRVDALRGHTACPYGFPAWAAQWASGYDKAAREGLAILPRFGTLRRRTR
jgi:hypothetical protein